MSTHSALDSDRTLASPLQEKEQVLEALTERAAHARKELRELTERIAKGQQEMEVLVQLFEERAEPDDEFARELLTTEKTAQLLGQRLAVVEQGFQAIESELRVRGSDPAALLQLHHGRSWRLAHALHQVRLAVFPSGSFRERLARLGLKGLRTWRREGIVAALHKGSHKIARKLARMARVEGTWAPLVPGEQVAARHLEPMSPPGAGQQPARGIISGPVGEPHVHVDELLQVDETSFYIKGWSWADDLRGPRLTAVSPGRSRTPLENLFRYARADIFTFFGVAPGEQGNRKPAFVGFFQTSAPALPTAGWTVESRGDNGTVARCTAPVSPRTWLQTRDSIFADLQLPGDRNLLLRHHVGPALQRLQAQTAAPEVDRVEQYGVPPAAPLSSLVIPLYRRIDFLEHQLAQFVRDPEVCRADLVYVLDSPELAETLHARALQLSRLYRVPFRIIYLKSNVGYAGATNAGVEKARGRLLVLLNSDVLPDRPGWLGQMAAFYLKNPRLGALGPKLVYEDETLQHAGMYFARQPGSAVWENAHFYKGLHRYFPAAQETRIVPAVTGACLMIKDDRYQEVGGLHNLYMQGDYEDSDLCLRLHQKGYDNWYLAECELYHLEGQSYPGPLRSLVYQYNSWLHTHLWGKHIAEIMAKVTLLPASTRDHPGRLAS